jgi:glycosyltransferase involved in cell wall biosynthesis
MPLAEQRHGPPSAERAPRISIVTPVYNQSRYIEATLRSVLSQNYPNLQYIVMDGGSRDGTWEIIQRFRDHLAFAHSGPDGGQAAAINAGMRKADGEIVAWLNGDDVLLPGTLAYVAAFFEQNAEVDAVYGHRIVIDADGLDIGRWVLPPHDGTVLSWMDFIPQETLFLRRSAFEKVGFRVDESFQFALDWDLLLRLRDAGVRFERLPRYLGGFRVHEAQKTSAAWSQDGVAETELLLRRCHQRIPTMRERRLRVLPYIAKHVVLQWADRLFHCY